MTRVLPGLFKKIHKEKGFTYPELVVIMGILAMLFGIVTLNLAKVQRKSSVNAIAQTLLSEIKEQQLKAMVSATEGRIISDNYGIYFESTKYTLFHGSVYSSSDTSNFPIPLDSFLTLTTTFPNSSLIFSRLSGEVVGFISGQNTITIKNIPGTEQKIITINKYGVITSID